MVELLVMLTFPLWVKYAPPSALSACCSWGTIKLAHMTERAAPLADIERVEASLNAAAAELDRRRWRRRRLQAVAS